MNAEQTHRPTRDPHDSLDVALAEFLLEAHDADTGQLDALTADKAESILNERDR